MSTSDRHEQGPLTRKQLREIRLTGSTPVITPEEAAAAASATPAAPPSTPVPQAAEPSDATTPASAETGLGGSSTRLTRRQVRELERSRSGSDAQSGEDDGSGGDARSEDAGAAGDSAGAEPSDQTGSAQPEAEPAQPDSSALADDDDDLDDDDSETLVATPVSASSGVDRSADVSVVPEAEVIDAAEAAAPASDDEPVGDESSDDSSDEERPTVNSTFGQAVLSDDAEPAKPFTPSFDELLTVGDSTGSQHRGGNTLIFNPAPGDGSLSGPVASTGEILVTGSYELPRGLGSQGHAHGTTDGKDVDAVLIDGELPPASSPTPIAASAAVSTIKPAGEVIRPPVPEKGNKLMLILAIVAGGLALALGVALIVAFTTNVF